MQKSRQSALATLRTYRATADGGPEILDIEVGTASWQYPVNSEDVGGTVFVSDGNRTFDSSRELELFLMQSRRDFDRFKFTFPAGEIEFTASWGSAEFAFKRNPKINPYPARAVIWQLDWYGSFDDKFRSYPIREWVEEAFISYGSGHGRDRLIDRRGVPLNPFFVVFGSVPGGQSFGA